MMEKTRAPPYRDCLPSPCGHSALSVQNYLLPNKYTKASPATPAPHPSAHSPPVRCLFPPSAPAAQLAPKSSTTPSPSIQPSHCGRPASLKCTSDKDTHVCTDLGSGPAVLQAMAERGGPSAPKGVVTQITVGAEVRMKRFPRRT